MPETLLPDVTTEEDVKTLVDAFYELVVDDTMLGPIFTEIAGVDWDKHLPTMYRFWSSMLLGSATYKGQPFSPHAALSEHITPRHFERWIELFFTTIDSHFSGTIAETAKQRAQSIAYIFQSKLAAITL